MIAHGSALLGCFFAVKAWSYGLDRYLLLYGDNGVVVGASYTDIHVGLPILWLLIGLSIVAAFAAWANLWVRTYRLPAAACGARLRRLLPAVRRGPGLFQHLFVKPNELQLEKPYIERNIALTQQAYNLHQITAKPFPAEQDLTFKTLEANKATIDNIRLWDWQPLMDTYAQLQEIRTYYKFHDLGRGPLLARRCVPKRDALGPRAEILACCRRTRRHGSTATCCSPTATAW